MENALMGLGAIVVILFAGFISFVILKGLWRGLVSVKDHGSDFVSKVAVSFGASVVAGVLGALMFGLELKLAGGVGLIGAAGGALFSKS